MAASQSTVAPSSFDVTTTTSTLPQVQTATASTDVLARGAAPETTTTTTTTTTIQPVRNAAFPNAPVAPSAQLGQAAAMVNGVAVEGVISRVNNTLVVRFGDIVLTLSALDADGNILPLDADGNIRLTGTRFLMVAANNLIPSTEVEVWLFSTPTKLATLRSSAKGTVKEKVEIASEIPNGNHRLVLKQQSSSKTATVMSVGIAIGKKKSSNWSIGLIIFPTLSVASIAALVIPARRRRRRNTATA